MPEIDQPLLSPAEMRLRSTLNEVTASFQYSYPKDRSEYSKPAGPKLISEAIELSAQLLATTDPDLKDRVSAAETLLKNGKDERITNSLMAAFGENEDVAKAINELDIPTIIELIDNQTPSELMVPLAFGDPENLAANKFIVSLATELAGNNQILLDVYKRLITETARQQLTTVIGIDFLNEVKAREQQKNSLPDKARELDDLRRSQ